MTTQARGNPRRLAPTAAAGFAHPPIPFGPGAPGAFGGLDV